MNDNALVCWGHINLKCEMQTVKSYFFSSCAQNWCVFGHDINMSCYFIYPLGESVVTNYYYYLLLQNQNVNTYGSQFIY